MLWLSMTLGLPLHEVRKIPSSDLSLYMAYQRIEPHGEYRADLRNALTRQQVANLHRDQKKHPHPFPVDDFMLSFERVTKEPDPDELRRKRQSIFGAKKDNG